MPFKAVLSLQGERLLLEEAIRICQEFRPECVDRNYATRLPEAARVMIRFDHITEEQRSRISHQLILRLTGKILVEWKAN